MKTLPLRRGLYTAGFISVLALAAGGGTAHAAGEEHAAKQEQGQPRAEAGQQDQRYGRDEPYEDRAEGESLLEPREQAEGRPLSDYNEAMVDPTIGNATPASLKGQEVSEADGDSVGTIEDVVRSSDGEDVRIVVSGEDVLGSGESRAAIPVAMFKLGDNDQIVLREEPSEENIQEMTAGYNEAEFEPVEEEQAVGFMPGQAVERG